MRHSCNLKGICEPDPLGIFSTLEHCQSLCPISSLSAEDEELALLISSHHRPYLLAPSDIQKYLRRKYSIFTTLDNSKRILEAILVSDWLTLSLFPEADNYLEENLDEFDFFLIEMFLPYQPSLNLNWEYIRMTIDIFLYELINRVNNRRIFLAGMTFTEEAFTTLTQLVLSWYSDAVGERFFLQPETVKVLKRWFPMILERDLI